MSTNNRFSILNLNSKKKNYNDNNNSDNKYEFKEYYKSNQKKYRNLSPINNNHTKNQQNININNLNNSNIKQINQKPILNSIIEGITGLNNTNNTNNSNTTNNLVTNTNNNNSLLLHHNEIFITKRNSLEMLSRYLQLDSKNTDLTNLLNINSSDYHIGTEYHSVNYNEYFLNSEIKYPNAVMVNFCNNNSNSNPNTEEDVSFIGYLDQTKWIYFVKDNILFLYSLESSSIHVIKDIKNVIVNIHMTEPKPSVFSQEECVKYILVVATTSEIYIFGVVDGRELNSNTGNTSSTNNIENTQNSFHLDFYNIIKTEFYIETSEVVSYISSFNNHILIGASNEMLYELDYYNHSGFLFGGFTRKITKNLIHSKSFFYKLLPSILGFRKFSYIKKIVIDNSRNMIHCLVYYANKSVISLDDESVVSCKIISYYIGIDDLDFIKKIEKSNENSLKINSKKLNFSKVAEINHSNLECLIRKEIESYYNKRYVNGSKNYIITDLYPITINESSNICIMFITKCNIKGYVYLEFEEFYNVNMNKNIRIPIKNKLYVSIRKLYDPVFKHNYSVGNNGNGGNNSNANVPFQFSKSFYLNNSKTFLYYKNTMTDKTILDLIEPEYRGRNEKEVYYMNKESFDAGIIGYNFSMNKGRHNNHNNHYNNTNTNNTGFGINHELITSILNMDSDSDLFNIHRLQYKSVFPELNDVINQGNLNFNNTNKISSNDYSTQFLLQGEEFLLLTSNRAMCLMKQRPIDKLFELLSNIVNNGNTEVIIQIEEFIKQHGILETAYMLLCISTSPDYSFFVFRRKENDNENLNTNNNIKLRLDYNSVSNNSASMNNNSNSSGSYVNEVNRKSNSPRIMQISMENLLRINQIIMKNYLSEDYNNINNTNNIPNNNNNNNNIKDFIHAQPHVESVKRRINYISYSIYMYIIRILRIFYEETYYKKVYINTNINKTNNTSNNTYTVRPTYNLAELKSLIKIFEDFRNIIHSKKNYIVEECARLKSLEHAYNNQNIQNIKYANNSTYNSNPKNNSNYIQNNNYSSSNLEFLLSDFSNISQEIDESLMLSDKIIESLKLRHFYL